MSARLHNSPSWQAARPTLSVLTPFLRDDPSALLAALEREAEALAGAVEIVLLDDGTQDQTLTARLEQQIRALALPVRLITLTENEGRSRGRNRLSAAARGQWWLFLDSDMRPDTDRFLQNWLDLIGQAQPAVAFGGFSLLQAPDEPRFAVHRAMALKSDCLPHDARALQPEKYVYTSNLLVRRDVFEAEAFDPGFSGWGWEDVEWAMRVSRRFPVLHIGNPATHMGLDTVETLAAKYEQSAANFGRVLARHPDFVRAYPSYRAARLMKHVPARGLVRKALKGAARTGWLPTAARGFSLRLYRAALYAEAV